MVRGVILSQFCRDGRKRMKINPYLMFFCRRGVFYRNFLLLIEICGTNIEETRLTGISIYNDRPDVLKRYLLIYSPRHKYEKHRQDPISLTSRATSSCVTCNWIVNTVNNTTKNTKFPGTSKTRQFPMRCSGIKKFYEYMKSV